MSDSLFSEFQEVSAKEWKQKIQVDLKGADYNETLLWKTNEGITVKPFYHKDELLKLPIVNHKKDFAICQSIFVSEEQTANFLAKDALRRGATSIQFEANEPFDLDLLLDKINIASNGALHFKLNFLSESFLLDLVKHIEDQRAFINIDLIGGLASSGNWFFDLKKDHAILEHVNKKTPSNVSLLSVDAGIYQNAGANAIQQVAYALAHANEYLNHFDGEGSLNNIQFHFAVGGNYFFEIAKLRAFRYLWDLIIGEYGVNTEAQLFVQPSLRNKTLYDYNVNLLRTTTECMSAILGGADTISNISYDSFYHKKNEFGERIARNQLIILKQESYLNEATNAAEGSYYIETLSQQIAEKALELFKGIERSGGFLKQLFEGTIQRKIEESAQKEQGQFDKGEKVLLGTNKYPSTNDKMKDELELYPFVKTKPRQTVIVPIIARRLSEKLEQERIDKEDV